MSNQKKAEKIGKFLSEIAAKAVIEPNCRKSERYLKIFRYVFDKATSYKDSNWSLYEIKEYQEKEIINYSLIYSLLNNPIKNEKRFPVISYSGWGSGGNLTPSPLQLCLVLTRTSMDIPKIDEEKEIEQKILAFFAKNPSFKDIDRHTFLTKISNCPSQNNLINSRIFNAAFNDQHAWIVRQIIYEFIQNNPSLVRYPDIL